LFLRPYNLTTVEKIAIVALVALMALLIGYADRKFKILQGEQVITNEENPAVLDIIDRLERIEKKLNDSTRTTTTTN